MAYAETQIGVARVRGLGADSAANPTMLFVLPAFAAGAQTSPEFRGARPSHEADVYKLKDSFGRTVTIFGLNDSIACAFTFKTMPADPVGANTRALALPSLWVPTAPATVSIVGLQIIKFGGFDNALNTNGSGISANKWIYEGGAGIDGDPDSDWGLTLTLHRYPLIAGAAVVTG